MMRELELSVPTPDLWAGKRAWRFSPSPMNSQPYLSIEASIKNPKGQVWKASGLVNTMRLRESCILERAGTSTPFPHALPCMHLFYLAAPDL